ncbi:hypothetical protein GmHk_19G055374 [Glycine max]|nr:hypothetical protein GmHk_19G055374 [Glycine max]
MRRHCRLWWPKQLLSNKESSSSILLGWFVTCSPSSLDIIAAFTCSEVLLSSYSPGIQMVSGIIQCNEGIIYGTWGSMPSVLEDKSKFSVLGLCVTDPTTSNGLMNGKEDDKKKFSEYGNALQEGGTDRKNNSRSCRCFQLDGSLRKSSQYVLGRSNWVLVMFDSPEQNDVGIHRLPKLHHIHWNGLTMSQYDVPALCCHGAPVFLILGFDLHHALATLHISTLHWFISLVYSSQIQALAAFWRLFSGRKWNPEAVVG